MKERNSAIEILRLLCIIMVILCHYCGHGVLSIISPIEVDNYSWQIFLSQIISSFGSIANNTFILITGFFAVKSGINYKKLIELIAETFFYAWIIYFICMQFGIISFSVHDFICSLIPIWFGYNWFISCYTILYIFIPYINIFIYSMCKKKYYTLS